MLPVTDVAYIFRVLAYKVGSIPITFLRSKFYIMFEGSSNFQ